MKLDTIQTSFASGEFAPSLFGRTDIAQYPNALEQLENFLVRPYGSVISTPGTEYINACKTGGATSIARLIPFIFSRTDSYVIEIGVGYFRFYTAGAVVVSSGTTPYEVAHTYTASEIPEIQIAQVNDVIYLAHSAHAPAKLTRISSNSWTLSNLSFIGGPFLPDNTSAVTITPSATTGSITLSASGNIFTPSGSTLGHKNTYWAINSAITDSTTGLQVRGYVQITSITNPSTAAATVIKNLKVTTATTNWAEGAWSDVRGWPARVCFHQQRLFFARTSYQPQNLWGSVPFVYEDYSVNTGQDDDALNIQLLSGESNDIKWIASGDKLVAGTYGGDFVIGSGDDSPLTPDNTNVLGKTSWGSEAIQPRRIGNFLYYVQRFYAKLREFFFTWDFNTYKSNDKTILAPHIAGVGGFKEMSYQQNPDTVLWAVCSSGVLATMTREVDQEIQGWAKQTTDGYYESVATIPSQDSPHDEVWVIVKRNISGSDVRYVERFKSQIVPDRQDKCFYVHSGLAYDAFNATSTPTSASISLSINSNTKLLLHCNGSHGAATFIDSAQGKVVTPSGNAQTVTDVKYFGSAAAFFDNILGNDSYVKLLLHFDNNVTDSSPSARSVTNTNVSFSSDTYKFGGYSAIFNGVNSQLVMADSADFFLSNNDFTIDFWWKPTDLTNGQGFYYQGSGVGNNTQIYWEASDSTLNIFVPGSSITHKICSFIPTVGVWYHIAFVRNGSNWYIFVNGISQSLTNSTDSASFVNYTGSVFVGSLDLATFGYPLAGYLEEFRFSNGIARWTSNFTIPSNFYAPSTSASYLNLSDSTDWTFGSGDFTIDFWFRTSSLPSAGQRWSIFEQLQIFATDNANGYHGELYNNGSFQFRAYNGTASAVVFSSAGTIAINTWYHVAIVRNGNSHILFINGTNVSSVTDTTSWPDAVAPLYIGRGTDTVNTYFFQGHLDDFRLTKGQALYTANFLIPTVEASNPIGSIYTVTSSASYFAAGSVGKRLRAIDASGLSVGEMTITGFTSGTVVIGTVTKDFDATSYAAGRWGISVAALSGLNHINGKTVNILSDGIKQAQKTVSSGAITLASDAFYINVGLPYTQKLKTLPQEAASQRGTAQGKLQRINQVGLKVYRSHTAFKIGRDSSNTDTLRAISSTLYSGTIANIMFKGDYKYGAQVYLENSDPLPIELLSIMTALDTQDK